MKKLKLNVANLEATEILSREELKKVLGGSGSGSGSGMCSVSKDCPAGSKLTNVTITDCIGNCSSDTGYVKCTGLTNTLIKLCDGTVLTGPTIP